MAESSSIASSTLKTSSSCWSISSCTRHLDKRNQSSQSPSIKSPPAKLGCCAGNKFLRAAAEGYVDMLCEASKRDTNAPASDDFLCLTPTLQAAQSGQLDALRILIGRGGDPERVSSLGSSGLHLAAAQNHLNCVSFLVNFGVNMWALDNELHTAKDLAAMGQCKQVLDYLDQMMAKQSAINTKSVQRLKDKAKAAAEKRIKQIRKQQLKAIKQVERDERQLAKMSQQRRLLKSAHSMSDIKLVGRASFGDGISFAPNEPSDQSTNSAQTVANFLAQRMQSRELLEGRARRPRIHLMSLLGGHSRPSQPQQPDLDSSYASSSSVSSTSGYLSSCSARSILKSALSSFDGPAPRPPPESTINRVRRPRYSDLVAVKQEELARRLDSDPDPDDGGPKGGASLKTSAGSKCDSLLGSRLRGLPMGGVSRKVHLKRLLFATNSHNAASSGPESSAERRGCKEHESCPRAGGSSSSLGLKRTKSEPDFGAAAMRKQLEEAESERNQEEDQEDGEHETRRRMGIPTPPPQPPPQPKVAMQPTYADERNPNQEGAEGGEPPQGQLFTQCLDQLKRQQQQNHLADEIGPDTSRARQSASRPRDHRALCSNSDELLRHQLIANEFPLRPSVIKQQLNMKVAGNPKRLPDHQRPPERDKLAGRRRKSTTIISVDSIGSVGSFLQRNPKAESPPSSLGAQTTGGGGCSSNSGNSPEATRSSSQSISSSSASASRSSPASALSDDAEQPRDCANIDENDSADGVLAAESRRKRQLLTRMQQMDLFLEANNLAELRDILARERIDFEALLLLNEDDLKSLSILLGPRRKLMAALERFRNHGDDADEQIRSQRLTVVDTQL